MATGKTRNRMVVKGGGLFQIRELSPAATDTWTNLGYIKSTGFVLEHTMVESMDERGLMINYQSAAEKLQATIQMMQSGIDELQLLQNSAEKIYEGFYAVRLPDAGNWQEMSVPLMRLRPGFSITRQSGEQPLESLFMALAVKQALTRTPTAFNIAADKSLVIAENASAQNAPSDAAATVYTNAW